MTSSNSVTDAENDRESECVDDYPPQEVRARGSKRIRFQTQLFGEAVPSDLKNLFHCQTSDVFEVVEVTKAERKSTLI